MNENGSSNLNPIPGHHSDSLNCIDIVVDTPGDRTVRPITGKRRELLLAEREKFARWLEWRKQQEAERKLPESTDPVHLQMD